MPRSLSHSLDTEIQKTSVAGPGAQSEKEMQLSELRYRRLFETAQDGILILDGQTGQIADVNPFLKNLLHYTSKELLGKQLWQIGVFKDIAESKAAFSELQLKGYIQYKDLPLRTKDGKVIAVEFVSNVYMVDTEKVIQCNIRDITSRKNAEAAIADKTKELETITRSQDQTKRAMLNVMEDLEKAKGVIEVEKAKDEAILASIGEGLVAVDNNRRVIVINKSAEKMLGWKMNDILGKEISALPLEDEEGHRLPIHKRPTTISLATGEKTKVTYFLVRKDNTRFPIAITATPINLNGKSIGLVEIIRDITHELAVDREKSEFVSLASHQLRSPLGIIKWYLDALVSDDAYKKTPTPIRGYLDEIYKSNERVLSLVRDLLSVSRIDQGRVKNAPKSVDLIKMIQEIVSQLRIIARKKRVILHLDIATHNLPRISIDTLQFHEAIENLISNAIEYSHESGKVTITVQKAGNALSISVKDTGIGISLNDQKRLFTKFFRSAKAIEHNPEGSGLGLYVVKSYVAGWGGDVSVQSAEGKGTTFTISLPIFNKTHKGG